MRGDPSPQALAEELRLSGVCVVRVPDLDLQQIRSEFRDTCRSFPEFKSGHDTQYVLGGFAALGNPASFHNPLVRKLREWAMVTLLPVFRAVINRSPDAPGPSDGDVLHGAFLEQTFDRMQFRLAGNAPMAETWHRDEAPECKAGDATFGGWLNLDTQPQYFSCILGSHSTVMQAGGRGYAQIKKDEAKGYATSQHKTRVPAPPGHIILFYESIVHEVIATKLKYDSIRLFLGWRLTRHLQPLYPSNITTCTDQGVPLIKSGQRPPMYSLMHWMNHRARLVEWTARNIRQQCTELKALRSQPDAQLRVVHRHMHSLRDYGLALYPAYTSSELSVFTPRRSWTLLPPGRTRVRRRYTL